MKLSTIKYLIIALIFGFFLANNGMSSTVVIPNPGTYNFGFPLEFALTEPNQPCIIIAANDVILDLSNYSITQMLGAEQPGTVGIAVASDVRNITIRNGSITNMTNFGIYVGDNVDTIKFQNIIINGAMNAGIKLDSQITGSGIRNIEFSNVEVKNILSINDDPACGILLKNVSIANFTDQSLISDIQSQTGNCYGLKVKNSSASLINNLISSKNSGSGYSTTGYFFVNSNSCILENCYAVDNISTSTMPDSFACGYYYRGSNNHTLNNALAIGTVGNFRSCGFNTSESTGIEFLNCSGFSSISYEDNAQGFFCDLGFGCTFNNCRSSGNNALINGYGILLNGMESSIIENCEISLNLGFTGTSFGINLSNDSQNGYIRNNRISGHSGGVGGFGIFDEAGANTTNIILGNLAFKNTVAFEPGEPTIPVFTGPLTDNPSIFENVAL